MNKLLSLFFIVAAVALSGCGERVEVPPAHLGKIITKDGYQEGLIPVSKFRLSPCLAYCDNLVILDASDVATPETMVIFMPEDKLEMTVTVQTNLAVNPPKAEALFNSIQAVSYDKYHEYLKDEDRVSLISWDDVYDTYAKQLILTAVREYLTQYKISEVTSSLVKINADLRERLYKVLHERSPFLVRDAGITNIRYPEIITKAQENAAERREKIQQEEAQLQISKVALERELQETRLRRQIELEKAQIEARSQQIQREVVDDKVLRLRELENARLWVEKWDGKLPSSVVGGGGASVLMQLPVPSQSSPSGK